MLMITVIRMKRKFFKNMSGNVQGRNFLGESLPDADIFATAKSFLVKSLLCSILNDYIWHLQRR